MSSPSYNSHISISSPFSDADLPTLCVWRNRLHRLNGEPEENLDAFMEEHLGRENVRTFAAYRDEELGGSFEAVPGAVNFLDSSCSAVRIEMVFKREFFKGRPESGNGAALSGQGVTRPALNLVLRELFEEDELAFFPLASNNRPIQSLVASVGAVNIGQVEGDTLMFLFILSRPEWRRQNAAFLNEYESIRNAEFSFVESEPEAVIPPD